jgi:hypothetical protein
MQNGCVRPGSALPDGLRGVEQLHPAELDRNVAIIKVAGIRPE